MPLSTSRLRSFKALSSGEASLAITAAEEEIAIYAAAAYVAPVGMATAAQISYFMNIRRRLGSPASADEIERHKLLTSEQMQAVNTETMQALQQHNDAQGVPLPAWRLERGLYDSDLLRAGQRAAAARQAERRAEIDARIAHRQQQRPVRRRSIAYPGEAGHS